MILPASPISPETERRGHIRSTHQTHTFVDSRTSNRGFTFGTRSSRTSCNSYNKLQEFSFIVELIEVNYTTESWRIKEAEQIPAALFSAYLVVLEAQVILQGRRHENDDIDYR